ncbi:bifunctional nuclease 1 [Daucus carota subsp. sativus]|nr:PREDICTED: bifunctional nuclease 1-like [Daucus carota subsp. sativus]
MPTFSCLSKHTSLKQQKQLVFLKFLSVCCSHLEIEMSSVQGHVISPVGVRGKQTKVHSPPANGLVQRHVIFPVAVSAKQTKVHTPPANALLRKDEISSGFWGVKGVSCGKTNVGDRLVNCSLSSSSDGRGSMAGNYDDYAVEYVYCSVMNAVEVKSSEKDGFVIKLISGRLLRCAHINPLAGKPPELSPHPAIVLRMEDGTGLLLPVLAMEMESKLAVLALRNAEKSRPTIYGDMMTMVEKMGYKVKLVRITKRVHQGFFSRLYLTKLGDESQNMTFDVRPPDAINIALRCKVPILVNKNLAYRHGMRVIKTLYHAALPESVIPKRDWRREAFEAALINSMLFALGQGRYEEAVFLRAIILEYIAYMNYKKNKKT